MPSRIADAKSLKVDVMSVAGTSIQRENGINDKPENNVKDLANTSSKYITDNPVFSLI